MSDDFDEAMERAKAVSEFYRLRYEEEVLARAEIALEEMPASTSLPMPNTVHPFYQRYADVDTSKLGYTLRVKIVQLPLKSFIGFVDEMKPEEIGHNDFVLVRKRCVAPAPFVGDPLWEFGVYVWDYWADDYGRHIAGDSKLDIVQRTTKAR